MTLESSVEDFVMRYGAHAASGILYPQAEGSPLMEFASGGRVLYLFDRTGPYAVRPGPGRVLVHGVVEAAQVVDAREEELSVLGVSAVEGVGEVLEARPDALVVRARLPLVLGRFGGWRDVQRGDWLHFRTAPPLHGFLTR